MSTIIHVPALDHFNFRLCLVTNIELLTLIFTTKYTSGSSKEPSYEEMAVEYVLFSL